MSKNRKASRLKIKFAVILGVIFMCSMIFFSVLVSAKGSRTEAPLYKYYTAVQIEKGDTLWKIAERYCYEDGSMEEYVEELKEINRLGSSEIHAGNYLTVVYYSNEYK